MRGGPLGAEFLFCLFWSHRERSSGPLFANSMVYSVAPLVCRVGVSSRHVVWYALIAEIGCLPFDERERWCSGLTYAPFVNCRPWKLLWFW